MSRDSASLLDRSDRQSPNSSANETCPSLPERHRARSLNRERKEKRHQDMDFSPNPDQQDSDEHNNESYSPGRSRSSTSSPYIVKTQSLDPHRGPSTRASERGRVTSRTGLNFDPCPDPGPPAPAPPPRSSSVGQASSSSSLSPSSSSLLQQQRERERQGASLLLNRDSLHSLHSCTRQATPFSPAPIPATVAPPPPDRAPDPCAVTPASCVRAPAKTAIGRAGVSSRWRFSSGDEEEECGKGKGSLVSRSSSTSFRGGGLEDRGGGGPFSHNKNGWWAGKVLGRSSGSEEDSPALLGPPGRDAVRRRSLRKKKKVIGTVATAAGRDDGESGDSDSDGRADVMMDNFEKYSTSSSSAHPARELPGMFWKQPKEPAERSRTRPVVAQWECNSITSSLPWVSRVSKVNISSFIPSPGGSGSNSRYSSTETLKEEDHTAHACRTARPSSSSMQSKTFHGNFTMYRSPSFGHGDNFSRAPARKGGQLVPPASTSAPGGGGTKGVGGAEMSKVHRGTLSGGRGASHKERNRMSLSNPDIASETMTLLSFLKTDLSELRVRKTDRSGAGPEGPSPVYRMGSRGGGTLPAGRRPSLKDLTATLRRAKSFTYSDKSAVLGGHSTTGPANRSSSEQQLPQDGERDAGRGSVSDRGVESDGGDCRVQGEGRPFGYEEVIPTPLEDRYLQEARQVIRDICQMSAREDEDDVEEAVSGKDKPAEEAFEGKGGASLSRERESSAEKGESERGARERRDGNNEARDKQTKHFQKGGSEENVFCDRSVDELSGHESSLTDEGIVTEPETGPGDHERLFAGPTGISLGSLIARDVLGQPLTVWKQSALHQAMDGADEPGPTVNFPAPLLENDEREENVAAAAAEAVSSSSSSIHSSVGRETRSGGALEAPSTPSAARRRRKFSAAGNNNGSDSSNASNGQESGNGSGDPTMYRSLSDPMPQRRCSVPEETSSTFSSVDSNLLSSLSLSVKGGGVGGVPESSLAANLSECTGSAASDLSVCSDGSLRDDSLRDDRSVHDYSGVIRSIVSEPGALDRLMTDEHNNGKAPKKKSFSDPSRRGDAPLLCHNDPEFKVQHHSAEPIRELDHLSQIPPSSSEPILSEQRDELWELGDERKRPSRHNRYDNANIKAGIRKPRSQSECVLLSPSQSGDLSDTADGGREARKFNFDPKLAEVLSPRMGRRNSRKRPNRVTQISPPEDVNPSEPAPASPGPESKQDQTDLTPPLPPLPVTSKPRIRPKHVRHASEPATFVPISLPPCAVLPAPEPRTLGKAPGEGAPSLEDVTKQYILRSAAEGEADSPGPGPRAGTGEGAGAGAGGSATPMVPLLDGSTQTPTSPAGTTEPQLQGKSSEEPLVPSAPQQRAKPRVDMRRHVMMTLLDTEQSYVESLRTLIQGYMRPLKQADSGGSLVDPYLVDEMFYQIPEILEHHEHFLEQVSGCVSQWHDRQTVGHLLIQSFSKEILANIYSAYIDNFLNAKDAVRIAKEAKPAFHKFLEQSMRENKEKQALGDLMIKPVQRIPRYELLVKDLLKHTPEDHPDHSFLLDAQRDIKRLAERINKGRRSAEEVEKETRVMQEIEAHIEGVEHILNPQRKFLRQEMVMEAKSVGGKKDRSLFLFSDLLICTTLKRKSGSLRRSSMSLYSAASVIDTSSKYKFLWKLPLEDIEMVKSSSQATNKEAIQKMIGRLDEDLSTLGQVSKLSETLSFPHQSLDEVIKDLMASVHRDLAEKQSLAFSMTFLPTKLELTTASAESSFVFEFTSPDARSNFEQAFEDAKKKLAMNKDQWDPEFLKAIPIMKTRSGMQFSCASPSHSCPDSSCEVWVCNSDGYVGQVCLLNIKDEPTVEACIAVCSARIICIAAVPGLKGRERTVEAAPTVPPTPPDSVPSQQQLHISISHSSLELTQPPAGAGPEPVPFDSDDTDDEDSPSPSSTLQSQASHSTISSSYGNEEVAGSKDMATETTSSEEEQEYPAASPYGAPALLVGGGGVGRPHAESPMDGRAMRRSSRGSFTRASLEDLLSIDPEAYQSSVWLGTEDGCIHVYQSSDNIRNRKNSMKMQHSASILCILYLDNKVFVSLANGEVIVYQREAGSFWDAHSSQTLCLGTPTSPVTKMVPVGGKLWCGSQNRVLIINTTTLVQEHWFQVGTDASRCVTCMVSYGQGVWLALQGSALVRLYHARTWESLVEVDTAPAVHKMLAGSDAIIRQHKAACLRITALLACKDLLWIGTSAGVVLTLAIPAVSFGTGAGTLRSPLIPMGSAHGHTGHVRFLTSIELPEGFDVNFPLPTTEVTGNQSQSGAIDRGAGGLQRKDSARRRASALIPAKTNQLVISGGDGYEDFRLTNSSETVGRDDSTNHLLLWRV
ncbi:rho guanine nucleotide exchange factor 17 [Aplochiton taeniatus]